MIRIVSTNVTSPLGLTTAENYAALRRGDTALRETDGCLGVPGRFCVGMFPEERRAELRLEGFSWFESLVLRSVRDALERCSVEPASDKTVFVLGTCTAGVDELGPVPEKDGAYLAPGAAAKKIASALGFRNDPILVSDACISGAAAQVLASRLISAGVYADAVVCGADVVSAFVLAGFSSLKALSPRECRPFDIERLGLNIGECAATMVLSGVAEMPSDGSGSAADGWKNCREGSSALGRGKNCQEGSQVLCGGKSCREDSPAFGGGKGCREDSQTLGDGGCPEESREPICGGGWNYVAGSLSNDAYHISAPIPSGDGVRRTLEEVLTLPQADTALQRAVSALPQADTEPHRAGSTLPQADAASGQDCSPLQQDCAALPQASSALQREAPGLPDGAPDGRPTDWLACITAHGTATMFNDQMESRAIADAGLGDVPVTALKSHWGHTFGASGVLEAIMTICALDEGVIPPVRGFSELGVSGKIDVCKTERHTDKRAFIKIQSGFGGCNASVVYARRQSLQTPAQNVSEQEAVLHEPARDMRDMSARKQVLPESERSVLSGPAGFDLVRRVVLSPSGVRIDGAAAQSSARPAVCGSAETAGSSAAFQSTGAALLTEIYRKCLSDDPKFYKSDPFSRLVYVGAALAVKDALGDCDPCRTAIILFTENGSVLADRRHLSTFCGSEGFYPSPAVFVNTLPNVVLGEIAAQYGIKGETDLVMLPGRDESLMRMIVEVTLDAVRPDALVCGWADCCAPDSFSADIRLYKNDKYRK